MIRRFIAIAGLVLTAACATSPTTDGRDARERDPAFRYGRNPGPSPVGAIPDVRLDDPTRNQPVVVSIDYPTRGGPHPLIVFSPGGGGSNREYPGLAAHWASYGYVVIRPAHVEPATAEDMTEARWRARTRDITFVLDSIATLEQRFPELQGKVDMNRIAVAGHARGAVAAMMLGGLRTFPGPASFADPRVKVIAVLSPYGPREMWGITNESFAGINIPALFMTGTRDTGSAATETFQWRQQAFELAPAGDKWLVTIEGVQHGTFTGRASAPGEVTRTPPVMIDPRDDPATAQREAERQRMERARAVGMDQRSLFETIRALSLAFFDAYLKQDAGGRQYLEQADARGNIEVRRK